MKKVTTEVKRLWLKWGCDADAVSNRDGSLKTVN
jgi:hypothetical protein